MPNPPTPTLERTAEPRPAGADLGRTGDAADSFLAPLFDIPDGGAAIVATVSLALPKGAVAALRGLGARCGVPLSHVLLAGWGALLHRLSGRPRIALSVAAAPGVLALDLDAVGSPSFRAFVDRVAAALASPVAAVEPRAGYRFATVGEPWVAEEGGAAFDVALEVVDGDALRLACRYRADRLSAAAALRWLRHLDVLLSAAAADAATPLDRLPLLAPAAVHQLAREWNDTGRAPVSTVPLHRLFEDQARLQPEALAVVQGDDAILYGDLELEAVRLARRLAEMGVGPEVRVGLLASGVARAV